MEYNRMTHQAPHPVGNYEPFVAHGQLVALSAISSARSGEPVVGKVGRDLDLAAGRDAAERAARNLLAVLTDTVSGNSARIVRVMMLRGYVNATDEFADIHKVVDAASDFLIAELGDKGRHARTSVGCATLPNGNAVTLEALAIIA
jgi:enamine deaminase RidA (YjgF/YER057c/UK114 family)